MSIIYVHQSVPRNVASLVAPKARRYARILMELEGHDPRMCGYGAGGLGLCDVISDTVAAAWKQRGLASWVAQGEYNAYSGKYNHFWSCVKEGQVSYSIDMTHLQTGSPYLIVVVPSDAESQFNLFRQGVREPQQDMVELLRDIHGPPLEELYELFRL